MFEKIITTFKKKNIEIITAKNKEEACKKVISMIPDNSSAGYGGSITIEQIGLLEKLRKKNILFFDRLKAEKGSKEQYVINRASMLSDFYITGANAITNDGLIVNVDKWGNRVASMLFGPTKVIIIAGKNKIVKNYSEAIKRIRETAAPLNAKRHNLKTPCTKTGKCMDCNSPERICCFTTIIDREPRPGRMTIILIDEDLGL